MASKNHMAGFEMLDNPWLRKQVEGHLLFGLFATKNKLLWSLIVLFGGLIVNITFHSLKSTDYISLVFNVQTLLIIFSIAYLAKFTGFYQAAVLWIATKFGFFFICFIFILTGIINYLRGLDGALYQITLGILWFPSIEFHPAIIKYQKTISIIRFFAAVILAPLI